MISIPIPGQSTSDGLDDILLYYPEDYSFDENDIFNEDSEQIRKIKWIIDNKLTDSEKAIFLMYTDRNSSASATAKVLHCTPATVRNYINRIRQKIKDNL
mgnify:CR=1 FL=1